MADMPMSKLNELLAKAVASLQEEQATLVQLDELGFQPWLPESYWRERKQAQDIAAGLLVRSVDVARAKIAKRMEDERLAAASVDDLVAEWERDLPTLQGDNEELRRAGWGQDRMDQTWRSPVTPSTTFQPRYDYECAFCGLPITNTTGEWLDHRGKRSCDKALVTWDMNEHDWPGHMAKPRDGEEEDP